MVVGCSTDEEQLMPTWADRAEESDDEGEDDGDYSAGDEGEEEVCALFQPAASSCAQKQHDPSWSHPPTSALDSSWPAHLACKARAHSKARATKQQRVARSRSRSRWCVPDRCCRCHCGVVCAQGGGEDDGDEDGDDGDEGEEEGYEEAEPGVELIVVSSRAAHGSSAGSSHRPAHPPGRVGLHPLCTGYLRDALPHTLGAHSVPRATRAAATPSCSARCVAARCCCRGLVCRVTSRPQRTRRSMRLTRPRTTARCASLLSTSTGYATSRRAAAASPVAAAAAAECLARPSTTVKRTLQQARSAWLCC